MENRFSCQNLLNAALLLLFKKTAEEQKASFHRTQLYVQTKWMNAVCFGIRSLVVSTCLLPFCCLLLLLLSVVTSMNRFHGNAYSVRWPRAIGRLTVFWPQFGRMVHHPNTKYLENTSNKFHNIYELQIKIKRLNWTAVQSEQQKIEWKGPKGMREGRVTRKSRTKIKITNTCTNKNRDIFPKPQEEWLNPCKCEQCVLALFVSKFWRLLLEIRFVVF